MESPNAPSADGHSRACRRGYDVSGDVRSRRGRGVNRGYEDRPSPLMDGNKPIMGPRRRDRGANPRHLRSLRRVPPHPAASPRVPAPAHPGVGLVDAAHLGPRPAQGEDPCRARSFECSPVGRHGARVDRAGTGAGLVRALGGDRDGTDEHRAHRRHGRDPVDWAGRCRRSRPHPLVRRGAVTESPNAAAYLATHPPRPRYAGMDRRTQLRHHPARCSGPGRPAADRGKRLPWVVRPPLTDSIGAHPATLAARHCPGASRRAARHRIGTPPCRR
jgi:hypothetical protein